MIMYTINLPAVLGLVDMLSPPRLDVPKPCEMISGATHMNNTDDTDTSTLYDAILISLWKHSRDKNRKATVY